MQMFSQVRKGVLKWAAAVLLISCPALGQTPVTPPDSPHVVRTVLPALNGSPLYLTLQVLPETALRIANGPAPPVPLRSHSDPNDGVLFDSILDYSSDGQADLLWGYPTRGYDDANDSNRLASDPLGTDSLWPNTSGNRIAQLTLVQVGQSVQISQMTFEGGLVNKITGNFATGSIAIIFWDGVYDAPDGLPYNGSGSTQTQKLAHTANGTNGYIIRFPTIASRLNFYTVTFDATNPAGSLHPFPTAAQQPMLITDPKGRFGYMIAAILDSKSSAPGTAGNAWYYDKGAANGLNAAFLYQNYNFTVATSANGTGGYTNTLKPGTVPSAGIVQGSTLIPGHAAYTPLTDADFNAGKLVSMTDPNTMQTIVTSPMLPVNPWVTFYGKKLDGTSFPTGELRGRVRNQGVDPDSPDSLTYVLESGSGTLLPGEKRPNRYRFSFITPPLDTAQVNTRLLWDPANLPAGYSVAYQQELYAQPSYGLSDDGTAVMPPAANTPLRFNYRLRGIPAGTYSLLVQQIPVYGSVTSGGMTTLLQDTFTPVSQYPGADFVGAFIAQVVINPSLWVGPTLAPENYTNTTVLDVKLHHAADIDDGSGQAKTSDGVVDIGDFGILVNSYGNMGEPGADPADFAGNGSVHNGEPDGVVDIADFGTLINQYNDGTQISESIGY